MIPAYPYGDEREEGDTFAGSNAPLLVSVFICFSTVFKMF
jgi:hypothetical protein